MNRLDIDDNLVHFTKSKDGNQDINIFCEIIHSKTLNCGNGFIKGGECCICFTETPHILLKNDPKYFTRYSPFGIMLKKEFIYNQGGRPVIYSSEEEFNLLQDELKYRYVKFDLASNPKIDFSWEREWRLKKETLIFNNENATLIFPNRISLNILMEKLQFQISLIKDTNNLLCDYFGDKEIFQYFIEQENEKYEFNWKVIFLDES